MLNLLRPRIAEPPRADQNAQKDMGMFIEAAAESQLPASRCHANNFTKVRRDVGGDAHTLRVASRPYMPALTTRS